MSSLRIGQRKGLLLGSQGARVSEVNIDNLSIQERKKILDRLLNVAEEDNEKFLLKLRDRVDRVGIDFPLIEVRFQHLHIEAEAHVKSRALPSFLNFNISIVEFLGIIYLFSRNMHDSSLPLSIITTCARLMLNLVEPIFEKAIDKSSMEEAKILFLLEEGDTGKDRTALRSKLELPLQPFPLQTSSLFGGPISPRLNVWAFVPGGVGPIPRHVNIHIHTAAGPMASNDAGMQGDRVNGAVSGDSCQTRVLPMRNIILAIS